MRTFLLCAAGTAVFAVPARAEPSARDTIIVMAPGGALDDDDAARLDRDDMDRAGTPDLLGGLTRALPGMSRLDAQGNPFQPNLVYRGFVASPLQGNAQGLAVYVDGVRFNQPFGDTVDFDLLPDAAIRSVTVKDLNPVYGLNALGGAIIVETETGRSAPGVIITAAGGDHGRAEGHVEAGWSKGPWSAFVSLEEQHDGGWRRHSPSTRYIGFADIGFNGTDFGLHVKLSGADSDLTGNGSAPVELLAADRRAVFTYPDNTRNRFGRLSLHPWVALSGATRLEASLYLQHLRQRTVNGDAADIESCEMAGNEGLLCLESAGGDDDDDAAEAQVLDRAGQPLADRLGGEGYGVLNRSLTRSTAGGALVQLVDRRTFNGGENVAILGVSHDRSRTGFQSSTELGELTDSRSVAGLGSIIDQPDGSIAPVSLIARTRYTGVFIADTLPLGPRWSLELAGRYNSARVILADRLGTALNGNHHFSRFNPGIELDFRASPALKLNLGYAETSRAPTPAELACASEDAPCSLTNFFVGDPPLRQVVAKSWTGGLSGSFLSGWTFDWRLSAWRTTNSNDIQFIAAGVRGRAFFRNVGRTRRQGVEATIKASRGPWTLHAGYAFTDATYRGALTLNSPDNPGADDAGRIMARPGDQMPGIARHRAVISADFARQGFLIGADLQAQSGQYLFGDEANLQPRTRAFIIVNARAEIPLLPFLRLFGRVENMLNRHYETFGIYSDPSEIALVEAPGASDPRSLGPGAPRRWLAGLSYQY